MSDELCENVHCRMDREYHGSRIRHLEFENRQLRKIVAVLTEPFAPKNEMSFEDAMVEIRRNKERPNDTRPEE